MLIATLLGTFIFHPILIYTSFIAKKYISVNLVAYFFRCSHLLQHRDPKSHKFPTSDKKFRSILKLISRSGVSKINFMISIDVRNMKQK